VLSAVEHLVKVGKSADAACKETTRVCNRSPHAQIQWKTIRAWYDESPLLPDDDPERIVIATYWGEGPHAEAREKLTADGILKNLTRTLKSIRPEKVSGKG